MPASVKASEHDHQQAVWDSPMMSGHDDDDDECLTRMGRRSSLTCGCGWRSCRPRRAAGRL
eukprot:2129380-Rhodomonas_salina.4